MIFGSVVGIAITYFCVAYFLVQSEKGWDTFGLSQSEIRKKYPDLSSLEKAEKDLEKNPEDIELRKEILAAYVRGNFFYERMMTVYPKESALWLIKNRPDISGPWFEWGMSLGLPPEKDPPWGLMEWKEQLQKFGDNISLLKNAGDCMGPKHFEFYVDCWKKVEKAEPLNPLPCSCIAHAYSLYGKNPQDLRESIKYYDRYFSFLWSADEFARLDFVRQRFHRLFFPDWVGKIILSIRAKIMARAADMYVTSRALDVALRLKDSSEIQKWKLALESILDDVGYHRYKAFAVLVRTETWNKNTEGIYRYIEKMLSVGKETGSHQNADFHVLEDLINAGYIEIAIDLFKKKVSEYPDYHLQMLKKKFSVLKDL